MKRMMVCLVAVLCSAGVLSAQEPAQTGRIMGTVVDAATGQPISGASITLRGTALATLTGAGGQFQLVGMPPGEHTLRSTYLGYGMTETTVTVRAGETAVVRLAMEVDAIALQEIVVVGYGTQRRQDVAGSITSVNVAPFEAVPVVSMDQMLQGTAAGVQVTQASNAPGGGISVRVRGTSSISGMSEPLYVIDGFPIDHDPEAASPGDGGAHTASVPSNPLAAMNPADIESIQILKDASATAIYGARGANGVVIITTRQGRISERPQVTFDVFSGTQEVARRYDLLTASELGTAMNELAERQGNPPLFTDQQLSAMGRGTDWQNEIFRRAPMSGVQGSVSGGTTGDNATRYAISGGFFDQGGVVRGSSFERYSLRANVRQHVGDRLRFGTNVSASRVNTSFVPTDGESNRRAGAIGLAMQSYPFLPAQTEDGRFPYQGRDLSMVGVGWSDAAELANAVSMATQVQDHLGDTRLLGNAFAEYEVVHGLRLRVSGGADYASRFRDTYYPRTTRRGEEASGEAIRGRAEILSYLNENTLTYDPRLPEGHRLSTLAGFTWQTYENARTSLSGTDFVTDVTGYNDISAARLQGIPTSDRTRWALQSLLGRVNYSLHDRYLLTLTGRYDGSSRFSDGRKWGFFPSVALAWRISDESFMQPLAESLTELKLRGSYGLAGNPGIRPYQSLARFTTDFYSFGGQAATGYFPIGVANRDLTWESTSQLDLGVDLSLFDRIHIMADYYDKRTDDLLLQVDLPAESGFARALINAGSVQNRGVELTVSGDVLHGGSPGAVRWNTGMSYARNRNEVLDLGGDIELRAGTISDDFKLGGTLVRVGEPIGVFVGYKTGGIVRDSAHAASLAGITNTTLGRAYQPGDVILEDLNGDGIIDFEDRTIIGSPHADFTLGWQNSLSYRGFELSSLLQGTFGNDVLNLNMWRLTGGNLATNILRERYEQRWTPDNPDARYPRLGVNTVGAGTTDYNDLIIEDGSYIRLQSLSLAYTLPTEWVAARGFSRARVYVTGTNLHTWTDYRGFDPDVSSFGVGNQNRGVDIGAYPAARSVTFGVNFAY